MRTFIAAFAAVAAVGSASAADLGAPIKAPLAPVAPAWSGPYIGFQFGWGASPDALMPGAIPPGFTPIFTSNALAGMPSGITAGGRVGYDWALGGAVWGIESDISWSDFKRDGSFTIDLLGGGGISWHEDTNWWGSSNLRLGVPFLANGALLYGIAGVAYGDRTVDATGFVGRFSTSSSFGGVGIGWDAGAGLAAKIGPSSEVFVEGRFVDLGSVSGQLTLTTPGTIFVAPASQQFRFGVGQAGFAYHF